MDLRPPSPRNEAQGDSPFVWATIGAIAQAAPGMHVMGVGAVEALNEHMFGDRWPEAAERRETLEEAIDVIRARIGDGYCTVGPDADAVRAYRERAVHRLWANDALPGELAQVLPTPAHFEQASQLVAEEQAAANVPCGPDVGRHVEAVAAYEAASFDECYVNQIGPEQDAFFAAYQRHALPRFRA